MRVEGRSPRTPETHATRLQAFKKFLQGGAHPSDPREISRHVVEAFLLESLEKSPNLAADRYRTLRAWYRWMISEDIVEASPLARIKQPKLQVAPPPLLADATVQKLLRATAGGTYYQRRDTAIVRLWLDTGIRVTEMATLTLASLDMEARQIRVVGKGNKVRVVPFGNKAALALDRYLRVRARSQSAPSSNALFLGDKGHLTRYSLERMLHRRAAKADIVERVYPHLFRHTLAHHWLMAGGSEGDLMRIMGWSSRSMLDRYGASAASARAEAAHRLLQPGDKY